MKKIQPNNTNNHTNKTTIIIVIMMMIMMIIIITIISIYITAPTGVQLILIIVSDRACCYKLILCFRTEQKILTNEHATSWECKTLKSKG